MEFYRYSTYPSPFSVKQELKKFDTRAVNSVFDDSCVDYTQHKPQGEITKAIKSGQISGILAEALYDFPDGVDNGYRPPKSRKKGVDLAEVSQEVQAMQSDVDSSIKKAARRAEAELAKQQGLQEQQRLQEQQGLQEA